MKYLKTELTLMTNKTCGILAVFILCTLCVTACSTITTSDDPTSTANAVTTKKSLHQAAENNLRLGLAYLEQGKIPQAKEKLLMALKQNPQNYSCYDAMGYFLERTGEAKAAEQYYLKAIKIVVHEGAGAAYNNYGTYLYRQKHYQEAIHYFMLAIKEPNYLHTADAYENAGLAALKIPDKNLANIYFEKAIANDHSKKARKIS